MFGMLKQMTAILNQPLTCVLDWTGAEEDDTDVNVWEDNWDDDDIEEDFSQQLRFVMDSPQQTQSRTILYDMITDYPQQTQFRTISYDLMITDYAQPTHSKTILYDLNVTDH